MEKEPRPLLFHASPRHSPLFPVFLISLFLLTLSLPVEAKTLYVDGAAGNDATTWAANGPSNPWRTIGRAAWGSTDRSAPIANEAARAGDSVIVAAGTYATGGNNGRWDVAYYTVNSGAPGSPITFTANGTVVLTSSGLGPTIGASFYAMGNYARDYIEWRGFTIDEANAPSASDTGPTVLARSQGSTLENLTIIGIPNNPRPDNYNGIRIEDSNGATIRNNRIMNFQGVFGRNHSAITTYRSSSLLIENNEISGIRTGNNNNSGSGIFIKGMSDGALPTYTWVTIRNNLIHDIEGAAILLHLAPNTPENPVRVHNNIVRNSLAAVRLQAFDQGNWDPRNAKIVNNTFVGVEYGVHVTNSMVDNAGHVVWNNIMAGGSMGISYDTPSPSNFAESRFDSEHNLYHVLTTMGSVGGPTYTLTSWRSAFPWNDSANPASLSQDPLFVSSGANDFHLQTGSPARTLGVDLLDLNNNGSTTDLIPAGAYVTGDEIIGRGGGGGSPDTTPPSVPGNLSAVAVSSTQINLSWSASTDNVGVAGYRIYRGGSQIAQATSGANYSNTGLAPSTQYSYTVAAYDAAGNVSAQSASASATTQAPPIPPIHFDDFEYVAGRDDPNATQIFQSHGWATAKTQQNSPNARGYLYTTNSIPGYSGSFPSGGSRVLAIEALPGTLNGQTDFYLQMGGGTVDYIPGDVWFQFWVYPQNYGTQMSRYGTRNKFLYACNGSYPCHSALWMVSQGSPNYTDPDNMFPLGNPSNGEFLWNLSSGVSSFTYTGGDPYATDQVGQTDISDWMRPNRWTLVKMHFNTTSTTGNSWEMWMRPYGGQWLKTAEWIGGVTPNFTWDISAEHVGGHTVLRMPTTVGATTGQWYDYWIYMDDFVMADSEAALPTYSDGGGPPTPPPPPSPRLDLSSYLPVNGPAAGGYRPG